MTDITTPTLATGQVWQSNDDGRRMILVAFEDERAVLRNEATGKQSKIQQSRLIAGGSKGYTLVDTISLIPAAISDFVAQYGFSPTVRELATTFDLPVPTMHRRLLALREAGLITWMEGTPRTLRVL